MESIVSIILAVLALVGNCGWIVAKRKYRQEVRKAEAEADREEFNLSAEYVKEFKEQVYAPLSEELQKLRSAIDKVSTCALYPDCPVVRDLRHEGDDEA